MKKRLSFIFIFLFHLVFLTTLCPAAETLCFYHTDAAGTPLAMTNASGTVVWKEVYRPFGEKQAITGTATNTKQFIGKDKDPETGLHAVGVRYMKDETGRFVSPDSVGAVDPANGKINTDIVIHPQMLNLYVYGLNNPSKYTDSDGKKVKFVNGSSNTFKNQFSQAIQYLNAGKVSGTFKKLESLPQTVYVEESPAGSNDDYYDRSTKTIGWDPLSALECTNGTKQSPALGLLHEADHALGDLTGTSASRLRIPGDPYGNAEERRVIVNHETPAATKLGEGTRIDHYGRTYQVARPIDR